MKLSDATGQREVPSRARKMHSLALSSARTFNHRAPEIFRPPLSKWRMQDSVFT